MDTDNPLEFVSKSLHKSQIIPNVIPEHFFPSLPISILYKHPITIGAHLNREDTLDEPDIAFTSTDATSTTTYTLVMTDPDAPSRDDPKFGQFRHWVVRLCLLFPNSPSSFHVCVQITGLVPATNHKAIKTKPSTTTYYPPGPPPGTGLHRYGRGYFNTA
jgi:phosphatidylethanolamine-binding protein (PEBP) family uncharacterized protein